MKPYQLRPATAEDIDLLKRLYRASRDRDLAMMPWPKELKETFVTQQFEMRQKDYGVNYAEAEDQIILVDDEPVGRILIDRSKSVWILADIVLLGKTRGQGIGGDLIRRLIMDARDAHKDLELHVETHNPAAALYQRLGFKAIEQTPTHIRMMISSADAEK